MKRRHGLRATVIGLSSTMIFINGISYSDGKQSFTHDRLKKAQRAITTIFRSKTLFTYIDPSLYDGLEHPRTNNVIEGG